jgi:transcriptional regulator with XRE-family HTH domain
MLILPEQCRAARALIGWSQDQLAESSRVAKATIANFEAGNRTPYDRTLADVAVALEAAGVEFLPEGESGAGVRLKLAVARLEQRRVSKFDRVVDLTVQYRNVSHKVRFSTDILDDLDRANHATDADFQQSFDKHQGKILLAVAVAVDNGTSGSPILLKHIDIPGA